MPLTANYEDVVEYWEDVPTLTMPSVHPESEYTDLEDDFIRDLKREMAGDPPPLPPSPPIRPRREVYSEVEIIDADEDRTLLEDAARDFREPRREPILGRFKRGMTHFYSERMFKSKLFLELINVNKDFFHKYGFNGRLIYSLLIRNVKYKGFGETNGNAIYKELGISRRNVYSLLKQFKDDKLIDDGLHPLEPADKYFYNYESQEGQWFRKLAYTKVFVPIKQKNGVSWRDSVVLWTIQFSFHRVTTLRGLSAMVGLDHRTVYNIIDKWDRLTFVEGIAKLFVDTRVFKKQNKLTVDQRDIGVFVSNLQPQIPHAIIGQIVDLAKGIDSGALYALVDKGHRTNDFSKFKHSGHNIIKELNKKLNRSR